MSPKRSKTPRDRQVSGAAEGSASVEQAADADEQLIRRYYAAFNARRFDECVAIISPDCEFDHVVTRDRTHGRRGYVALVHQWLDASSDLTLAAERIVRLEPGRYRVRLHLQGHRDGEFPIGRTGRLPADGSRLDFVGTHDIDVRGGLIVSSRFSYDPADLTGG